MARDRETLCQAVRGGKLKHALVVPADVRDVEQVEEAAQRVLDDDDPERIDRAAQRRSVRRLGSPEDVAEAVLFVARSPSINGTVLYVDGGPEVFRGEGAHV